MMPKMPLLLFICQNFNGDAKRWRVLKIRIVLVVVVILRNFHPCKKILYIVKENTGTSHSA